jgi:hypothetical protein
MNVKKNFFMSLIERVTKKAEILEELCDTIPQDIEYKKEKREEWNLWHTEWKKAWIERSKSDLSDTEINVKRLETSITTKYKAIE